MSFILFKLIPLKNDLSRIIIPQGIILFLFCASLEAQENPWISEPKGENPWVTEDPKKETTSENNNDVKVDSTLILTTRTDKPTSTSSQDQFIFNDRIITIDKRNRNYKLKLKKEGKKLYTYNAQLTCGILTGAVINVYALPINIIGSFVPTKRTNALMNQFEKDNPKATVAESKSVRRGITQKRLGKALTGNLIGAGINIIALIMLFA